MNSIFFFGIVKDIMDPKKAGRIKVQVIGEHENIQSNSLPWAQVMLPITSASNGYGISPTGIQVDSWIVGYYIDGDSKQQPLIIGSIPGKDIIDRSQNNYPNNNVIKSKSGHYIEIDDTPGSERINIEHKSGAKIEIGDNGKVSITTPNETYIKSSKTIIDNDVTVKGTITATVDCVANGTSLNSHKHLGNLGRPTSLPDKVISSLVGESTESDADKFKNHKHNNGYNNSPTGGVI